MSRQHSEFERRLRQEDTISQYVKKTQKILLESLSPTVENLNRCHQIKEFKGKLSYRARIDVWLRGKEDRIHLGKKRWCERERKMVKWRFLHMRIELPHVSLTFWKLFFLFLWNNCSFRVSIVGDSMDARLIRNNIATNTQLHEVVRVHHYQKPYLMTLFKFLYRNTEEVINTLRTIIPETLSNLQGIKYHPMSFRSLIAVCALRTCHTEQQWSSMELHGSVLNGDSGSFYIANLKRTMSRIRNSIW